MGGFSTTDLVILIGGLLLWMAFLVYFVFFFKQRDRRFGFDEDDETERLLKHGEQYGGDVMR